MVKGHLAISYHGPFSAEAQSWDPPHYDNSAAVSQCFSLCRLLSPWIQCLSTAPINWQSLPIYRRNQVSRWWSPEASETLGKSMALSHAVTTQYVNSSYWMRTVYNQHAPIQRGRFHSARNQLPKSLNMNIVDSDSDQTQFPRHICFRGCLLILWVSSPGLPQDLLF